MPPQLGSGFDEIRETTFCDEHGNPFLILSYDKATLIGPNREVTVHSHQAGIRTACGMMWFAYMLYSRPPILVTTCSVCRNPPVSLFRRNRATHGIVIVRNARVCVACGRTICPQHSRASHDGWRCITCAKRAKAAQLLAPFFFSERS